jgi:hypothetical protein
VAAVVPDSRGVVRSIVRLIVVDKVLAQVHLEVRGTTGMLWVEPRIQVGNAYSGAVGSLYELAVLAVTSVAIPVVLRFYGVGSILRVWTASCCESCERVLLRLGFPLLR